MFELLPRPKLMYSCSMCRARTNVWWKYSCYTTIPTNFLLKMFLLNILIITTNVFHRHVVETYPLLNKFPFNVHNITTDVLLKSFLSNKITTDILNLLKMITDVLSKAVLLNVLNITTNVLLKILQQVGSCFVLFWRSVPYNTPASHGNESCEMT